MYREGIIIFCLTIVHPFLCYGKANTISDPILEYLNMDPKHVMEHELINIYLSEHMHKRSSANNQDPRGTEMRFRAFNGDINLWLHPRDSLFASIETPVYFAHKNDNVPGGVSYVLEPDAMKKVGQLYEDANHYASVVIGSDEYDDQPTVTGNIKLRGDNAALVIRSLPEEVVEEHLRKRRSIDGNNVDSSLNSARHVVLKIKDHFPKNNIGEGHKKVNVGGNSATPIRFIDDDTQVVYSRSIYPKIFVEIDYTYYNQYSSRSQSKVSKMINLLEYVLAFWNGVDLSYRHLENPNFRFHIAGIAIATSPAATPYISTSRISQDGTFDPEIAINEAALFYYDVGNQISFDMYDIAAIMTKLEMKEPTIGIAAVGAACNDPIRRRSKDGVALVHDDGGFGGIATAVHEIGHSLGLRHDDGKRYPECDNSHGFVMGSSTNPTENTSMFSACSLAQFNQILKMGGLECLYDAPKKIAKNLPTLMPGKLLSLDQQCQAANYDKACGWHATRPCVQLSCTSQIVRSPTRIIEYCQRLSHGAAPGTPCGNKNDINPRFCLQSRCVSFD